MSALARRAPWACLLLLGCLGSSPSVKEYGPCENDAGTIACLTLVYYPTPDVRKQVKSQTGTLHWGLYQGGDVGLFGPGDNESLYGGPVAVDFARTGAAPVEADGAEITFPAIDGGSEAAITLRGLPARAYQALGYFDIDGDGDASSGDAVSLPSSEFTVPAGTLLRVEVPLDYVR